MKKRKSLQWLRNIQVALYSVLGVLTVVTFACLQPGLQPEGYRISPVVCPPREMDNRGYCFVHRDGDYARLHHSIGEVPMFMHISRASVSGTEDTITTVGFSHGRFFTLRLNPPDDYPPQNRVDSFVQSVRDRRTELYSEMGWPDPNPPAIPPLNR